MRAALIWHCRRIGPSGTNAAFDACTRGCWSGLYKIGQQHGVECKANPILGARHTQAGKKSPHKTPLHARRTRVCGLCASVHSAHPMMIADGEPGPKHLSHPPLISGHMHVELEETGLPAASKLPNASTGNMRCFAARY